MSRTTALSVSLSIAVLALGVAACGTPPTPGAPTTAAPASTLSTTAAAITLTDGWAKAGRDMTGAFGTLKNSTDTPITLTTAASDVANRTELHPMAKQDDGTMKMVRKEDGFVVPAHGTVQLVPGGDHVMLIGLAKELRNGDRVRITLTASSGESFEWTVPVRSFAGAEETYLPGATSTGASH